MIPDFEAGGLELGGRHALAHGHRNDVQKVLLDGDEQVRTDVLGVPCGPSDREHGVLEQTRLDEIRLSDRELLELRVQGRAREECNLHGGVRAEISREELIDRLVDFLVFVRARAPVDAVARPRVHVLSYVFEDGLRRRGCAAEEERGGRDEGSEGTDAHDALTSSERASCCTSDTTPEWKR